MRLPVALRIRLLAAVYGIEVTDETTLLEFSSRARHYAR